MEKTAEYEYDEKGNLKSITIDGIVVNSYEHDSKGTLMVEKITNYEFDTDENRVIPGHEIVINYEYDSEGRLIRRIESTKD